MSKLAPTSITLDHPRLLATDGGSIQVLLCNYEQHSDEVLSRLRQLSLSLSSNKPVRPFRLKFCVDVNFLESTIVLLITPGVTSYDETTDEQVRTFSGVRAREAKDVVNPDLLNKSVQDELNTKMKNSNSKAPLQDLIASYHTILRRIGHGWIIKDNKRVKFALVLSAI